MNYNKYIYFKPWARIAPYIIGILLGYVMFYKKTLKFGRFSTVSSSPLLQSFIPINPFINPVKKGSLSEVFNIQT